MQWGSDVDAKLFVHILRIHNIKLDYVALAQAMGNDCTPKAITHRIARLKEISKEMDNPSPSAGTPKKKRGPPMGSTPTKSPATNKRTADGSAKKATDKMSKATANKIKSEASINDSDDDETSMNVQQHPRKKAKSATAKHAAPGSASTHRALGVTEEDLARGYYADGEPVEELNA